MVMTYHKLTTENVFMQPFQPYIITDEDLILYFSQSFAAISGLNPSQSSPRLSQLNLQDVSFNLLEESHSIYSVYSCQKKSSQPLLIHELWIEDLIHELRTSSLLMGLGTRLLQETLSSSLPYLFKTLQTASHRQKLSTLIASDLIQILSYPPPLTLSPLSGILSKSWGFSPDPSRVRFHVQVGNGYSDSYFQPNPIIYGDEHFLTNFCITALTWFETEPVTIELEQLNSVSTRLSFCIPYSHYLSSLQSYRLINHYLQYVAAYFNLRCWLTQSTFNLVFPLSLDKKVSN
jgi:hypothetical protein